jgi:hypothetical protein
MSRYERKVYFERLVELRLAYAVLDDDDRTSTMTIDEAIAWAERELEATPTADPRPKTDA